MLSSIDGLLYAAIGFVQKDHLAICRTCLNKRYKLPIWQAALTECRIHQWFKYRSDNIVGRCFFGRPSLTLKIWQYRSRIIWGGRGVRAWGSDQLCQIPQACSQKAHVCCVITTQLKMSDCCKLQAMALAWDSSIKSPQASAATMELALWCRGIGSISFLSFWCEQHVPPVNNLCCAVSVHHACF